MDIGPAKGGMSVEGVSYGEIKAWSILTDMPMVPWSAAALHGLSKAYALEYRRNMEATQTPPWLPEVTEDRARTIAKKAMMVFS